MSAQWTSLQGIIVQGYRVASGPSKDYPYGALDRQRPIFTSRGLNLSGYFNGTLNIDIHPNTFKLIKPEYTFQHVEWTDLHPPEHLSFSRCKVIYKDIILNTKAGCITRAARQNCATFRTLRFWR